MPLAFAVTGIQPASLVTNVAEHCHLAVNLAGIIQIDGNTLSLWTNGQFVKIIDADV